MQSGFHKGAALQHSQHESLKEGWGLGLGFSPWIGMKSPRELEPSCSLGTPPDQLHQKLWVEGPRQQYFITLSWGFECGTQMENYSPGPLLMDHLGL